MNPNAILFFILLAAAVFIACGWLSPSLLRHLAAVCEARAAAIDASLDTYDRIHQSASERLGIREKAPQLWSDGDTRA